MSTRISYDPLRRPSYRNGYVSAKHATGLLGVNYRPRPPRCLFSWVADAVEFGAVSFGDRRAVATFTPLIALTMSRFGFHDPRVSGDASSEHRSVCPAIGVGKESYYAVPLTAVQVELGRRPWL